MYKNEHKFPYITYDEVREKANKKLCSFINFASKDSMRMGVCCHEASHACDAIEDAIGMEHGGEPSAYLIGWIASCINNARLGIGDFVEIVDKEEKIAQRQNTIWCLPHHYI